MGLFKAVGLAMALTQPLVAGYSVERVERRQDAVSARYCDPDQKSVCYAQFSTPTTGTVYRIAIPEVAKAPFDTLVQVVAPNSVAWAALAWGGSMSANPLSVAWMADNQGVVSSRWASGHTPPTAYTGASYRVLSGNKNASHWQINFLCTGCSVWGTSSLNPSGINKLAFATSNRAPATPAANTSSISIHSEKGVLSQDLSVGKVDSNSFRRFVLFLSDHQAQQPPAPGADNGPQQQPADPPPNRGRIPTTIIRPTPTGDGGEEPAPPRPTTQAPPVQPTQRPGSTPGPVRTSITTVPRPPPSTQQPIYVTVTVTQGGGRTTSTPVRPPAKATGKTTTSCYRREGAGGSRVCTSVPVPVQSPRPGDDDDDDDSNWWGGGRTGWGKK